MKIVSEMKKEILCSLVQTFFVVHDDLCLIVVLLKSHKMVSLLEHIVIPSFAVVVPSKQKCQLPS